MATASIISAASLAAGAYLNAKLGVSEDLKQLSYEREWGIRLGKRIQQLGDTCTLYHVFDLANPNAEALWFEGRTWTYGELKKDVHRLAAFFHEKGIRCKDVIAVFMTNSPEMVVTILALSKLGAISGLINTSLRGDTLKHCLGVTKTQTIISTPDLSEFVIEPLQHISLNISSFNGISPSNRASISCINLEDLPYPAIVAPPAKATPRDISTLVFTSGSTGMPKACAIRNMHFAAVSNPLPHDMRDPQKYLPLRTYSPLPLFHGTALFTGLSYCIGMSSTFCLGRKFSASRFWEEVTNSRATRVIYVGELCRYLLAAPPSSYDRGHACIVANGNGLRGEIWEKFRDRFGVPEIREFYRSTEGLAKFDNFGESAAAAGKLGFAGLVRRHVETDTFIVKANPLTEELHRDPKTGFCVEAGFGEPGECIGRVNDRGMLTEYLNNSEATNDKLIYDVFIKGDCFQRMGDMLVRNPDGWVQFHDRLGDTFRWKGENVSAGEVRDHIAKFSGVQDVIVFGVKLPSYDGQAGAAAITLKSQSDDEFMSRLYLGLKKTGLPQYAIPRLVRITKEIEATATFKKSKGDTAKRSWVQDANENSDKLYWLNGQVYEKLDGASWASIEVGRAKL